MEGQRILDLDECSDFRLALQQRPPRHLGAAVWLLLALVAFSIGWAGLTMASVVVRADGRVRSKTSPTEPLNTVDGQPVVAQTEGRVVEVLAHEGDRVAQGDVLLRLDAERLDNEIAREERLLAAEREELAGLDELDARASREVAASKARGEAAMEAEAEGVSDAERRKEGEGRVARMTLESSQADEVRLDTLAKAGAASAVEVERAKERVHQAQQELELAMMPVRKGRLEVIRQEMEELEKGAALRQQEREMRRASLRGNLEASEKALANLRIERKGFSLTSPTAGIVTLQQARIGEVLRVGQVVLAISPEQGFRVDVAVSSADVGRLALGMTARVKFDAYDYQRYGFVEGRVCFISPDSQTRETQFVQGSTYYMVQVEIDADQLERDEWRGRLKLGMTAHVEVVTGRERLLGLLFRRVRQEVSLD